MSFCKGGFGKVKDFLSKIEGTLETIIAETTNITGKIKAIEGSPTAEAIEALIPNGSVYVGYLNTGLDLLVKVEGQALTFAQKLEAWLEGESDDAKDMKLVKLAQVSTAAADGNKEKQSFYDTAVQVHIEGLK